MVKHTQAIRQLTNCWNVFDHFVRLARKGLTLIVSEDPVDCAEFNQELDIVVVYHPQSSI